MTGIDNYDWSVFGGNPVPGDPDAVRAIAGAFADLADTAEAQNGLLRAAGTDAQSIWVGPAATKFHPHVTTLSGQLDKLVASHRDAADALNGYWPKLAAAQQLAVTALSKAQAATAAQQSAGSQVSAAQSAVSSAGNAYNTASSALTANPSPQPSDVSNVHSLQTAYQGAQSQLSSANAALAAAGAQLAAAQQLKDQAVSQARAASSAAAAALHAASAAGIQNPHESFLGGLADDLGISTIVGWGEDAVHFGEHAGTWLAGHWEQVALDVTGAGEIIDAAHWLSHNWVRVLKDASAVLGVVSVVAGVLSLVPFVGEVALPIAIVASLAQTADDMALAGTGNAGWGSVGWDLVGDVSFGAGAGLGKVADGLIEAEEASTKVAAATSEISRLSGQAESLGRDSEALHSFSSYTVPLLRADGPTQWVKVADLADTTDAALADTHGSIAAFQRTLAESSSKVTELGGQLGDAGSTFRFALGGLHGTDEALTTKLGQFFKNPVEYSRTLLNTSDGSSVLDHVQSGWSEHWSGAGRLPYRVAVGVGAGASGIGAWQNEVSWHDIASGK